MPPATNHDPDAGLSLYEVAAAICATLDVAGGTGTVYAALERAQLRGMAVHGPCTCTPPPMTDGPEETCPQHGRPNSYWIERGDTLHQRIERARALHAAEPDPHSGPAADRPTMAWCRRCQTSWPCDTELALRGAGVGAAAAS